MRVNTKLYVTSPAHTMTHIYKHTYRHTHIVKELNTVFKSEINSIRRNIFYFEIHSNLVVLKIPSFYAARRDAVRETGH